MKRYEPTVLRMVASPSRILAVALLGMALLPLPGAAQQRHEFRTVKECRGAPGPFVVGSQVTCDITFTNKDTFNDTVAVEVTDDIFHDLANPDHLVLTHGPSDPDTTLKGGCFNGISDFGSPSATFFDFFPDQACSTDSDCNSASSPSPPNGACVTGACVGGLNDKGFCRFSPLGSSCPGGTCAGRVCSGGTNAGRACCDCPGGTCMGGACAFPGDKACCVGGANNGNPCCECPGGACAQGKCTGGTSDGAMCALDSQCPGARCDILLPREGSVTVTATETVEPTDPQLPGSLLTDTGKGVGLDQGTFLTFAVPGPAAVEVAPTTTTTLPPPGCRITGGGTVNGVLDPNIMAEITKAQFAGQVGAPCGCFGCFDKFDPKLASVQGEWKHQRKNKGGSLHANTFNSLVCSCLGGTVGELCPDAEHPTTPADHICITGTGQFVPETGKKQPIDVAFRFEATDRGEPGNNDYYEMHIFTPGAGQTVEQLAQAICCTNPISVLPMTGVVANDQGLLVAGNIQIHEALKKSTDGECPPPRGVCTPLP